MGSSRWARASAAASSSLMPSRRVTSAKRSARLARARARCWSTARKASRSSAMGWTVVGTRRLRTASSAACTDHATETGMSASRAMARGLGPTVDTVTRVRLKSKPSRSTSRSSVCCTWVALFNGSPMPMKTTLDTSGSPSSRARRLARYTWASISAEERERTRPIRPVAQKTHARAQPTWLEIQRVVRSRFDSVCLFDGIKTASTELPS
mmetsp:Transcript_56975/g.150120  ORF Transcript_56975/g.150120 Transcript_56975/m.150120 type:complete len:210 (+) Transcript_56975:191-820(+)